VKLVTPYDAPRNAQRRAVPLKSLLRPKALPRTRESGCVAIHRVSHPPRGSDFQPLGVTERGHQLARILWDFAYLCWANT
jgi:hypothetical protein